MHPHCLSHFTSLTCTTINTHKPHHSHAPPSPLTLHITHMHLHCLSHFTSLTCTTIPSHTSHHSHAPPSPLTLHISHMHHHQHPRSVVVMDAGRSCFNAAVVSISAQLALHLPLNCTHTHTHTHTASQQLSHKPP